MSPATPGRGKILFPSKHRIVVYSSGEGFTWAIKRPLPSDELLAVSQSATPYQRARDAERQALIFFKRHRVDFLLRERRADFSQQPQAPCTTPKS